MILIAGAAGRVFCLGSVTDLFFGVGVFLGGTLLLLSPWVTGSGWGMVFLCVWIGFFGIGWYSLFLVQVAESTV